MKIKFNKKDSGYVYSSKLRRYTINFGYDVICRNKEAEKFIKIIGSNNEKNIKKWGCCDSDADLTVSTNCKSSA
jgi:hypothetical protein